MKVSQKERYYAVIYDEKKGLFRVVPAIDDGYGINCSTKNHEIEIGTYFGHKYKGYINTEDIVGFLSNELENQRRVLKELDIKDDKQNEEHKLRWGSCKDIEEIIKDIEVVEVCN